MKINAIKSSKTIKIDDYTAIKIICALQQAEYANRAAGFTETADDLKEVRDALRKAYCIINPNAYCKDGD